MKTNLRKLTLAISTVLMAGTINTLSAQWIVGSPSGTLELDPSYNSSNNKYVQGNSATSYALQIQTPSNGYLQIGPQNSSWCHFMTDRNYFYMNKPLTIGSNGGANSIVSSYESNDLALQTGNFGSGGTTRITASYSTGYVGIGTTSPSARLHVNSVDANGEIALFTNGGGGTYNGVEALIATGIASNWDWSGETLAGDCGIFWSDGLNGAGKNKNSGFVIAPATGNALGMRIAASGNVGIGTSSPAYPLDVAGTVRAYEVKVCTSGCDFVFEDGYKLMSLDDLDKYVTTNHHLPDVAPAKDMQTNGMALSQTVSALLQKVEELTLYTIQQEKEIKELRQKLDDVNIMK